MPKPSTLPLGSISHGTLKVEDLLEALLSALDDIKLSARDRSTVRKIQSDWTTATTQYTDDLYDLVFADDLYSLLLDLAQEYTPPYCYLGMHEGDGSDLGVWIDDQALSDARVDGELIDIGDAAPSYILVTNDHGNQTLYRAELKPVWEVV